MRFAEDIEKAAGEEIQSIVIGAFGWGSWEDDNPYAEEDRHKPASARKGELLSWDEARPLLNYDYDDGYGAPECHAITVWTENLVLWVTQYDGSTYISSIYRNPVEHRPNMPGG